jgi:hypothetical protein
MQTGVTPRWRVLRAMEVAAFMTVMLWELGRGRGEREKGGVAG